MKIKRIHLISSVCILAAISVHAANSADLSVQGVIRPVACTASLSHAGVVDYGTIPATSLLAGTYTPLGKKSIPFAITCEAAIKIALKASDNRSDTIVSGIVDLVSDAWLYGLGTVSGQKVGSYLMYFPQEEATTENGPVNQIVSTDGNQTWFPTGSGVGTGMLGNDRAFSWAAPQGVVPMPFKTIRGNVHVYAFLNKPEELPLTQNVPLNGSATLEIIYL